MDRAAFDVALWKIRTLPKAAPDERMQLVGKLTVLARERGIDPRTLTFRQAEQLLAESGAGEDQRADFPSADR
jgi:hypothetical protein